MPKLKREPVCTCYYLGTLKQSCPIHGEEKEQATNQTKCMHCGKIVLEHSTHICGEKLQEIVADKGETEGDRKFKTEQNGKDKIIKVYKEALEKIAYYGTMTIEKVVDIAQQVLAEKPQDKTL